MPDQDSGHIGRPPLFEEKLHVGRPNVGDRERLFERINDILDRRWLSNNGPYVQAFEREVSDITGVKHCIATCNATAALEIVARATGLSGEVVMPSFTFIATAHALRWLGITPVFCDINPQTHNIDPSRVEEAITDRTSAIMGVHLWGRPCDVDGLRDIAGRHSLKLLFDAAHAFGCSHRGRMIGNFGDAEVFSFHATKFVNSFEGGMIATNDDGLAMKMRLMRNLGFSGFDNVVFLGTNARMPEVSAAMGLTSLESMDEFIAVNRRNYFEYQKQLSSIRGVHLIPYDETETCNYQYIVLEVDEATSGIGRDDLQQRLMGENVLARRYFYPGCHRMKPYGSELQSGDPSPLAVTEEIASRVLCLPTGTAVELEHIGKICAIIGQAISEQAAERGRMRP